MELLKEAGCHAVFLPSSLYHPGTNAPTAADTSMVVGANEAAGAPSDAHSTWVTVDSLSAGLCADTRPHFFRGVATVCAARGAESELCCSQCSHLSWPLQQVICKIFNIVDPDVAIFGKKDYQQWRVLEVRAESVAR